MTATKAALELDSIRYGIIRGESGLEARVDAIGAWLASQKYSKRLAAMLTDASQLRDRMNGGSGKAGNRLAIG